MASKIEIFWNKIHNNTSYTEHVTPIILSVSGLRISNSTASIKIVTDQLSLSRQPQSGKLRKSWSWFVFIADMFNILVFSMAILSDFWFYSVIQYLSTLIIVAITTKIKMLRTKLWFCGRYDHAFSVKRGQRVRGTPLLTQSMKCSARRTWCHGNRSLNNFQTTVTISINSYS